MLIHIEACRKNKYFFLIIKTAFLKLSKSQYKYTDKNELLHQTLHQTKICTLWQNETIDVVLGFGINAQNLHFSSLLIFIFKMLPILK